MTEEEAKTKWCPMVRYHNGADGNVYSNNPNSDLPDNEYDKTDKCIASDCMMWVTREKIEKIEPISTDDGYVAMYKANIIIEGHCGLAK